MKLMDIDKRFTFTLWRNIKSNRSVIASDYSAKLIYVALTYRKENGQLQPPCPISVGADPLSSNHMQQIL